MAEVFSIKVYITYFYHVRNLPAHAIPVSTARFDPKWFHGFKGDRHIFIDRRGVYNGLALRELAPSPALPSCKNCMIAGTVERSGCAFLKGYKEQIRQLDFQRILSQFSSLCDFVKSERKFDVDPYIVLLVYEKPDNPCSERVPLMEWFNENGATLEEWSPTLQI